MEHTRSNPSSLFLQRLAVLVALLVLGCTAGTGPSTGPGPGFDAPPDDPSDPSSPSTPDRPPPHTGPIFPLQLLVLISASGDVEDYATVMTLSERGILEETDVHLPIAQSPRAMAISPSSREYAIANGLGPRTDEGIVIVTVGATSDSASITQDIRFGTDLSPYSVAYANEDTILVTLQGPEGGRLMTLRRSEDGDFARDALIDIGPGPRELQPLPEANRALLFRSDLLGGGSELAVLGDDSGDWEILGPGAMLEETPIEMATSPDGSMVYVPLYDPATSASTRSGLLHVFERSADGTTYAPARDPMPLPSGGLLLASSPEGDNAVVATPRFDGMNYGLLTLELAEDGMPMLLGPAVSSVPGVLMTELMMTPGGYLVTSTLETGRKYSIRVLTETGAGEWAESSTVVTDGLVQQILIAPNPGPD